MRTIIIDQNKLPSLNEIVKGTLVVLKDTTNLNTTEMEICKLSPYRPLNTEEKKEIIINYFKNIKQDEERFFFILLNHIITTHEEYLSLETIDGLLDFFIIKTASERKVIRMISLSCYVKLVLLSANAKKRFDAKHEDLMIFFELFSTASEETLMNTLSLFNIYIKEDFSKEVVIKLIPFLIQHLYNACMPFKASYIVSILNKIKEKCILSTNEYNKLILEETKEKTYNPIIRNDYFPHVGVFLDMYKN